MHIRPVPYDHPDAVKLSDQVLQEYVELYGPSEDGGTDGDATPLDASMFLPPQGLYLIAYDETGHPLASGAWRSQDGNPEGYEDGDAELKRMYVVPEARGLGLARRILAALESDARAAGRTRMVLSTGAPQRAAIGLYASSGYTPTPRTFGHYRDHDDVRCLAKDLRSRA
ncbi:GNAT family N-acetyltransferase [Streptomyces sp. NPDC048057]|uniref:GNAT family N-acetyltransferase n=1 Tax=Streptomyces sp. NPDC048057 TaxID=3155628 RepID=UPI0033E8059B